MTITQKQSEILNKIWNPEIPILLIDPPLTTEEYKTARTSSWCFNTTRINVEENGCLLIYQESAIRNGGASTMSHSVKCLDVRFQRQVYGCSQYRTDKRCATIYYLGTTPYTSTRSQVQQWEYWHENLNEVSLIEYIQLTANLIKNSY